MATFVNDTFTGSAVELSTHTGEFGATWTLNPGYAQTLSLDGSGALLGSGGSQTAYYASGSPGAGADYSVAAEVEYVAAGGANLVAVAGRMSTSTNTFYMVTIGDGFGVALYSVVTGGPTDITGGGFSPGTLASGDKVVLKLDMVGTSIKGKCQRVSDSKWLNTSNAFVTGETHFCNITSSTITAAGKAGVAWMQGSKFKFNSFSAADATSGGTYSATPSTIPDEDASITLTLAGSGTTWAGGGSEFSVSGLSGVAKVSESVASTTSATLVVETVGGTTGTLTITDADGFTTTVTVATASLARTPTSANTSSTTTITLTGTNTLWTQETAAGLFSVSGVSGCSISGTPTVTDDDTASISLVTGSSTGTLTITDNSNGATTTVTVASGPTTIGVNDTNVFFSPYNWYSDGAGSMASNNVKGSSTYAVSNNPGAYIKTKIAVASSGHVYLNVDTAHMSGFSGASSWPMIAYSIDGAAPSTHLMATGETQVDLGTLSAATHTIVVWFKSIGQFSVDRWSAAPPPNSIKVTGFEAPSGSTTSAPTLRTKRLIVFGDSITEGLHNLSSSSDNDGQNAGYTWAQFVAEALDAEVGIIGFGGAATNAGGVGNAPAGTTSYSLYSSGRSRLVSGLFSPAPDYVINNYGENGVDNTSHTTMLASTRTAAPNAIIFLVDPFTGNHSLSGVTLPSAPAYRIDVSGTSSGGILDYYTGYQSPVHPDIPGSANIAAKLRRAMEQYVGSATSFGTFGAGRL